MTKGAFKILAEWIIVLLTCGNRGRGTANEHVVHDIGVGWTIRIAGNITTSASPVINLRGVLSPY